MQLELNEQERAEVVRILNAALGETNSEIHHAMSHEAREDYRNKHTLLKGLLERLGAAPTPAR